MSSPHPPGDQAAVDEPTHPESEPVLQLDVLDVGSRIDADAVLALTDHDGPDPALVHSIFSTRGEPRYLVVPEPEQFDAVITTRNTLTARGLTPRHLDLHGLSREEAAGIAQQVLRERPLHEMVAHQSWTAVAEALHPGLTAGPDWKTLADTLRRAHRAGVDLATTLPALAQDPLPHTRPAQELRYRLLQNHPLDQPVDPGPARTRAALDPPRAAPAEPPSPGQGSRPSPGI